MELKAHGKTIIFISHKLKEVKRIADRVTVMRDARVITTRDAAGMTEQRSPSSWWAARSALRASPRPGHRGAAAQRPRAVLRQ